MFYGGFGTSWKTAVPIAVPKEAVLHPRGGGYGSPGCSAILCCILSPGGLLIGSVIASTDAASVFAIPPFLQDFELSPAAWPSSEIESGSNDPMAYIADHGGAFPDVGDEMAVLPL